MKLKLKLCKVCKSKIPLGKEGYYHGQYPLCKMCWNRLKRINVFEYKMIKPASSIRFYEKR